MAFSPVKSYNFGGLRATNSSGPIATKQQYGGLAGLLSGGLRATSNTGPITQGFNTGIGSYTGASPSDAAKQQAYGSYDPSQAANGFNFGPGGPTVDQLSTDPILQQIRAAGQMAVQQARQGALAASENDLIGYGGVTVPQSLRDLFASDTSNPIYAALNDANTASAAAANPDSTLKQLARTDLQNNAGIDQSNNARNTFYGSARANDLGAEADSYRGAQSSAAQNLAGLLGNANQGVLDTQNMANQNYLNGLSGAWDRWLQMQSMFPSSTSTPTSGGTTSTSGDTYYNPVTGKSQTQRPQYGTWVV